MAANCLKLIPTLKLFTVLVLRKHFVQILSARYNIYHINISFQNVVFVSNKNLRASHKLNLVILNAHSNLLLVM